MTATLGKVKQIAADKEAKLELRINVGSTAKNGDPVTFEILKAADDSQLDTVSGTITKGKAVGTWTAKGPEPTGAERSWRVYYKVTIGNEEAVSPELEVYLDSLELTSQDEDGASLPDAGFTVFVGKAEKGKKATTGSTGTFKVTGLAPGELRVEWKAPIRQIGDFVVDGAGQKTAKLKKSFKAKLLFPDTDPHEQWTNQKPDKASPEFGSKLKVRATCIDDDGPTRKGDVFYVKVTWADEATLSKRNSPRRALDGAKKTDWSGDGLGKTFTIKKDGAECVFEVQLGMAGMDKVTIEVGGTDTVDDGAKVDVTNRRKLFFQVTHRDTLAAPPSMDPMSAALDLVGVVYERYDIVKFAEGEKGMPHAFIDGDEVNCPGERLVAIGDHNKDWFHKKKFKDTKKPLGVHVLLCDLQLDGGSPSPHSQDFKFDMDSATADVQTKLTPFKTSIVNGKFGLIGAKWASKAPRGHADHNKKGPISEADVSVNPFTKTITINLPTPPADFVGDGSGAQHPVEVRFTARVAKGPYNGESDGPRQLMATKQFNDTHDKADDRTVDKFNQTMTHELGHTMNQVVRKSTAPPGLKFKDHGRSYVGHDHTGPHCAEGLSQGDFDTKASFRGLACTCIMYGESGNSRTNDFCDRCKPFVVAERLTTL